MGVREPVLLVEIDQDQCALEYGTTNAAGTCPAAGSEKCFNTLYTCQARDAYTKDTLTLRFCRAQAEVPFSWGAIPSVQSASTVPTRINPGGGDKNRGPLGSRARVTVTLQDHPHSDFMVDKYRSERPYDPMERGTFWTKWLRRNPYFVNRPLRIREGYIDQYPGDMVTRHYIIRDIEGPDASGRVSIIAEDVLGLADNEKAQAPKATEGELLSDISASASSLTIVNWRSSDDYPSSGTVRIGDEVMTYSSKSVSGDEITLSGLTRGTDGTDAEEHDAEDGVQLCLRVDNRPVWEVVRDLLQDYAGISSDFIPFADWEEEASVWLPQFTVTTLITEPTGVNTLLGELTEQCLFFIWWDERDQEIKLKALRPPTETPTELNDYAHIKADGWSIRSDLNQRISQIWIYYLQRNPTEKLEEPTNYQRLRIRIDSDAETDDQYDERRVKRIYSRWLETGAQAINVGARVLARYRDGAKYLRLTLDAKDRDLWTGDVADVSLRALVDEFGAPMQERYQVISAEEVQPGETVEYDLLRYEFVGRFGFWMESGAPDYADASTQDLQMGAWWANDSGTMPDGDDSWEWQ